MRDRGARDFFFNRVMFPISDARGRIIAFGARALDADAKPKYINTGETTLFSKGQLLYNFATARAAAIKAQTIIVAEGYMDVIALVRAGFDYAVAPLGTALTEDQLHLLWRTAPEPILAFDGDEAGSARRASRRASGAAASEARLFAALCVPARRRGSGHAHRATGRGRDAQASRRGAAAVEGAVARGDRGQGFLHARTPRRSGAHAGRDRLAIGDSKIADYYRRDFDQQVFDTFKRRAPRAAANRARADDRNQWRGRGERRGRFPARRSRRCRPR